MATITLDVPDELHERLKRSAKHHRRSVDEEAISCLEQALGRPTASEFLEEIRSARAQMRNVYVTDDDLRAARDEGRSV